jgi:hypothetical protein
VITFRERVLLALIAAGGETGNDDHKIARATSITKSVCASWGHEAQYSDTCLRCFEKVRK